MPNSENIDVELSSSSDGHTTTHHAIIKDQTAQRAWSGEGDSAGKAATEATRKFIADRRVKEYMPK